MKPYQKWILQIKKNIDPEFLDKIKVPLMLFSVALFSFFFFLTPNNENSPKSDVQNNTNTENFNYTNSSKYAKAFIFESFNLKKNEEIKNTQLKDNSQKDNVQPNNIQPKTIDAVKYFNSQNTLKNNNVSITFPVRNWDVKNDLNLTAKSALVITETGRILFSKNPNQKRQIASLTKLLTAKVVLENVKEDEVIKISKEAIETEGIAGRFKIGETFTRDDLLKIMLMISSNDAAAAFYYHLKDKNIDLVNLMNKKVKELQLKNTHFSNVIGLDDKNNYSTASDFAKIAFYVIKDKTIQDILKRKTDIVYPLNNKDNAKFLISSNKLIFEENNFAKIKILGGKTGYTSLAGASLVEYFEIEKNNNNKLKAVSVLLGADDLNLRFLETKKIFQWLERAFVF